MMWLLLLVGGENIGARYGWEGVGAVLLMCDMTSFSMGLIGGYRVTPNSPPWYLLSCGINHSSVGYGWEGVGTYW
jgi:hypothetical protein